MSVLKVLVVALFVCAVFAADVEVESDRPRKSRGNKKMVTPTILPTKHFMPKKHIVIVPKGDPRARPPTANPFTPVLQSTTCASAGGSCIAQSQCTGTIKYGLCPGSTYCCVPSSSSNTPGCAAKQGQCMLQSACTTGNIITGLCPGSTYCCGPKQVIDTTTCPVYADVPTVRKVGNSNVMYDVVPIAAQHFSYPDRLSWSDQLADNTILKVPTGCAFARMAAAAAAEGVALKINSGFRSYARQKYFWDCYQSQKCNGGNVAAYPGNSNHGRGQAVDLNSDCGRQDGAAHPPAACKSSKVYMWLLNNAQKYGFIRAVQSEPWHWEYKSGSNPSWAFF